MRGFVRSGAGGDRRIFGAGPMATGSTSRRWSRLVLWALGLLLLAEVLLRTVFGFGDMVLMRTDPHYEYIALPDQERHRFGNRIAYNSLSMRSPEPDSSAIVLLGCGDSVINGGMLTDQDSLATSLLSRWLSEDQGRAVQVLNISAGSWGAGNCAAFLRHTPLPRARALIYFASSHDAHDNMAFDTVVGRNPNFPDEQYASAVMEVVHRYLLPRLFGGRTSDADLGIRKDAHTFDPGFMALKGWADAQGIPFVVHLHAERSEIEAGAYNAQGQEIVRFARDQGVRLVQDLDHGVSETKLRDMIHPDEAGQRQLARIVHDDIRAHPEAYGLAP